MLLGYILFTFLALLFYKVVIKDWYLEHKQCQIPGPRGYPILYNFIEVTKNKDIIFDHLLANTLKYGRTWSARYPLLPRFVYIVDPACVDYVLSKNFKNYIKGPELQDHLRDALGDGIFNANGLAWKKQRQIASYLFSTKSIKNMEPIFIRQSHFLLKKLDELKGEVVEIQGLFQRFSIDSLGEILFGVNVDSMTHQDIPFLTAFNDCLTCIDARFSTPGWNYMPFLPSERRLRKALKICDQFAYSLIDEHEKDPLLNERPDLLSRYMTQTDEEGRPFSRKYLRDIIMNFLIAGRDSTAQTLSWCFYLLSQNIEQQEKLIEEIDTVLQGNDPTYELIKQMPYLRGAIEETLRIFPPIPVDPKWAAADDVLPDGTKIKKGYAVEWSQWLMGRHPDFWAEPMKFCPERWNGPEFNGGKPLPNSTPPFIPFQYGPRVCIGQQVAYFEVKIALCLILQKFKLIIVPNQKVIPHATIVLCAKHGIKMLICPRDEQSKQS